MARCGCGTGTGDTNCNCLIVNGNGTSVAGNGNAGTPYDLDVVPDPVAGNVLTVSPAGVLVSCESIQDCVGQGMGPGLIYDDGANQYRARISTDPGNTMIFGGDSGLYTPSSPVTLGCGLEFGALGVIQVNTAGDFSTLTRETCTDSADDDTFTGFPGPDTEGMQVYCDSAGNLRTYPEKFTDIASANINEGFAPGITVLPFTTTAISMTLTNPSSQYCMCGLAVFAFIPGISGDAGTVVAMNHEIDFGIGGGFVAQTGGVMDNRGKTASSGALQRPEFTTAICLDPGETKLIQHRVRYARFTGDNGGAVLITSTAKSMRWMGTNI